MDLDKPMRTSEALKQGITRWELAQVPWVHSHHGVVRIGANEEPSAQDRIDDAVPLLTPGAVLTGWAAAHRQGVRMLDGIARNGDLQPVTIVSLERGQLRARPGILPSRRRIQRNEYEMHEGVPMATIARAAYDMALDAGNLCETLVAIDMCTSTVIRQSRTTLANVKELVDRHKKTRGIVRARRAVGLASTRSASPWETRTRYVAEINAGISSLLVNAPIFRLDGTLAGIADLLDESTGFVIESDGAGHREPVAHTKDNRREEGLERLGLVVSRVTAIDHRDRSALTSRLQEARLHARLLKSEKRWTLEKPDWWWTWPPARRWD